MLFSFIFKNYIEKNTSAEVYKPIDRINRLNQIHKKFFEISNEKIEKYTIKQEGIDFNTLRIKLSNLRCSRREKALIYSKFNFNNLEIYDSASIYKLKYLITILENNYLIKKSSCSNLINDLNLLFSLSLLDNDKANNFNNFSFEKHLTEKISWKWNLPCLYHKQNDQLFYISGSISNCLKDKVLFFRDLNFAKDTIKLGQIVNNEFAFLPKKESIQGPFLLTLNPMIQNVLYTYKKCFINNKLCDNISLSDYTAAQNINIIILNSKTSQVLGALCYGKNCSKSGLGVYKDLASFFVNSPPASISKLLYGLAFGSAIEIDKKMLHNQIKTSGQLDSKLGKRNEWWEKKAICDGYKQKSCNSVKKVIGFSNLFGFSTSCKNLEINNGYFQLDKVPNKFNCGKITLGRSSHLSNYPFSFKFLSGFQGVIPLGDNFFLDSQGKSNFISWEEYNSTRKSREISNKEEYVNTSHVIQSVIGGGDSRFSALGIASLSAQIYQLSKNLRPNLPAIVTSIDYEYNQRNQHNNKFISQIDIIAARHVVNGMKKVILKSESNWKGEGTGYRAYKKIFKQDCNKDCPLMGKTGTVSFEDANYRGTTLFTGVIDSSRIQGVKVLGVPDLAIGILSQTETNQMKGHLAAEIFMSLVKDIFFDLNNNNFYTTMNANK